MLTSVKTVILKVIRDLNLGTKEIPWQDLVEWCAEGLQHIGAYSQYVEKETVLDVDNYRAKLPEDFYRVLPTFAHKLLGDCIQVGCKSGTVTLKYLAFATDEEGYPLIPDNIQYATALFWKCAMQLSIRGELPNKELTFLLCKQRWDWYCRQAGASKTLNPTLMHRFATAWTAAIPSTAADIPLPTASSVHPAPIGGALYLY